MVDKHIQQAGHNKDFLTCIESQFANNFYDWKITAVYYECLHYLRAYINKEGAAVGNSHKDIAKLVGDSSSLTAIVIVETYAWFCYRTLLRQSWSARYDGFIDIDAFNAAKKLDYEDCLRRAETFKRFIFSKGITVPSPS